MYLLEKTKMNALNVVVRSKKDFLFRAAQAPQFQIDKEIGLSSKLAMIA